MACAAQEDSGGRLIQTTAAHTLGAHRRFVLVSGLPAGGKSTIAHAVASFLDLPVIDKDDILERLFDEKGLGDLAWRRQLSRDSDIAFQAEATAAADGAVLTSFWHVPGMPATSGTPVDWVFALSPLVIELRCMCPASIAANRFLSRKRHPGHLDATRDPDEVRATFEALASLNTLGIADIVEVDTTRPLSAAIVASDLEDAFFRCRVRHAGDLGTTVGPTDVD